MSRSLAPLAGAAFGVFVPVPLAAPGGVLVGSEAGGPERIDPLLVAAQPVHIGEAVPAFGADFYDRVYYSWLVQDLGNVIGEQAITLYVWNAFRRAELLNGITATGADGVTLSGGPPLPYAYPPMRQVAYTMTVTTEGPATLDATFAFDWQTTDAVARVIGSRITAWSFLPDWSGGVLERLEWKTDVLRTYDGREQRRALRLAPRKGWEFDCFIDGADRRYAESVLFGWGARVWALPSWPDGQALASPVALGAVSIAVDTTTRDFAADSLVLLLGGTRSFEVAEVQAVAPGAVTLKRGLSSAWPAGTAIYPARAARIRGGAAATRWNHDGQAMRLAFDVVEPVDYTADAGATTYRGYPVMTRRPEWDGGAPEIELERKLSSFDNMTGPPIFEDEAGIPLVVHRLRWRLPSRADVDAWRRLAYALRGRQGAIWLPTWADDLQVVALIEQTATAIDVAHVDYTRMVSSATGRRDLRIELTDGTVYHRRVTGSAQLSATTERLVIDQALGRTVPAAEVAQVSFMALVRAEADQTELAYWTGDVVDVAATLRGFQHDV